MADEFSFTISGIEEACAMLDRIPKETVKIGFARALSAAAVPMFKAVQSRTPSRSELFDYETFTPIAGTVEKRSLKDSLRTDVSLDAEGKGGVASIYFTGQQGHVANWLEYGHRIFTHWLREHYTSLFSGKKKTRRIGGHREVGAVQPRPFLRPAAEESAEAAIDAFSDTLVDALVTETDWASVGEKAA